MISVKITIQKFYTYLMPKEGCSQPLLVIIRAIAKEYNAFLESFLQQHRTVQIVNKDVNKQYTTETYYYLMYLVEHIIFIYAYK